MTNSLWSMHVLFQEFLFVYFTKYEEKSRMPLCSDNSLNQSQILPVTFNVYLHSKCHPN
jgi:hypothetical protein